MLNQSIVTFMTASSPNCLSWFCLFNLSWTKAGLRSTRYPKTGYTAFLQVKCPLRHPINCVSLYDCKFCVLHWQI